MSSFYLELDQNKLHYHRYGHGPEVLLAFHGFRKDHTCFSLFSQSVSRQYTLYAIDFFYHGKSTWQPEDIPLERHQWASIIQRLLNKHGITRFSVLGYSFGGKLALLTFDHFPQQVNALVLIAPDGIQSYLWQSLATSSFVMRTLFRKTITHPHFFFRLVRIFQLTGLISKGWAQFALSQMKNRKNRMLVYQTWMLTRKLKPNVKQAIKHINAHRIPLKVFIGKYDRVVKETPIRHFLNAIHDYELYVLETGHNELLHHVSAFYQKQQAN